MIPPPIKQSRILVSGGVVIVISVKLYEQNLWLRRLWLRVAVKFPFPDILRPEQKVALCAANKISRLTLPALPLPESSFLKLFSALRTTNFFGF
jgi:hypothetical protein